ncbi:MAG: Mu transposase C-terminal domain-containing protein, partial [Blautia sp.]|nr:Mu transposase C-terminal domain-containing protein [Blautia sp.]
CMETYQRPPELIRAGIRPIPRDLWNYGMQFQSGALRVIRKEDIYRILLPRDKASVTDRGICFRGLYYTCGQAKNESWFDKARIAGRWSIPVNYDPTCLDHIYLPADEGMLIQCDLLSKSSAYQGFSEEDMGEALERDKQARAQAAQEEEKAKTNLILELETLVGRCQKEKKDGGVAAVGNVLDKHRLRDQRKAEKEEQSGESAARDAQARQDTDKGAHEALYETAGDALDNAIDEALRDAGVFDDEEGEL